VNLSPRDLGFLTRACAVQAAILDEVADRKVFRELGNRLHAELNRTLWRSDGRFAKRGTVEIVGPFVDGYAAFEFALRRNKHRS
jgi:hypothetical protein